MRSIGLSRLVLLTLLLAGGRQLAASADVSAWFVPSATKVLRDAKPDQVHVRLICLPQGTKPRHASWCCVPTNR